MASEREKRRDRQRAAARRRKRQEQERLERAAWKAKRRPAGHFALHVPPGARLTGMSEWRPDVTSDSIDWTDRK